MQTGGGCGDAAVVSRVHRLIALLIGSCGGASDVRRQRYFAEFGECPTRVECADEPNAAQATPEDLHDFGCAVVTERDTPARLELAAGMRHREPRSVTQVAHQQELGVLSPFSLAPEAGREAARC